MARPFAGLLFLTSSSMMSFIIYHQAEGYPIEYIYGERRCKYGGSHEKYINLFQLSIPFGLAPVVNMVPCIASSATVHLNFVRNVARYVLGLLFDEILGWCEEDNFPAHSDLFTDFKVFYQQDSDECLAQTCA